MNKTNQNIDLGRTLNLIKWWGSSFIDSSTFTSGSILSGNTHLYIKRSVWDNVKMIVNLINILALKISLL